YYLAPATGRRWHWITPGSIFALVAWLVMSSALRLYVTEFVNYNATYGSIGSVILLMLWLYASGVALLVGAEIDSVVDEADGGDAAPPPAPPASGGKNVTTWPAVGGRPGVASCPFTSTTRARTPGSPTRRATASTADASGTSTVTAPCASGPARDARTA